MFYGSSSSSSSSSLPEAEVVSVVVVDDLSPTMLTTWSKVEVMPPSRPRLAFCIEPNSFDEPSVMRDLSALVASSTDWLTILVSIPASTQSPETRTPGDTLAQSTVVAGAHALMLL